VLGNYVEALKYHQSALQIHKKNSDRRGMAASTHNLGILYQKLEQYDSSLEYYNQALKYWKELDEEYNLASTLNSIGAVSELKGNLNEALIYYKQALAIWEKSGSKYSIAIALNNIGSIYLSLKNYPESLGHLTKAIEIRRGLGDKGGTASSLLVLADLHNQMGNVEKAISTGREGLKLAKESGGWSAIREAHSVLAHIYEHNRFYKEALIEFKQFKAVHDSIFNSQSQETIAELEAKYKTEEQKQRIKLLERNNEIQNLYRSILIAGLAAAIIFMLLLYNRYRFKKQAHETLEKFHKSEMDTAEAKAAVLQMEFEQKKKELEAARDLQLSMLPNKIPEHPKAEIAAFMQTASEVGGDYYDFHQHPDGSLTMVIGDATGHGAQAGTIVTATKSLFSLLAQNEDIADTLNHINYSIRKMHLPNLFMAMGLVRLKNDTLELAGAGMPPALIYRASTGNIESASLKGLPMGSFADINYSKTSIKLNKGDVVALMSDGLPELFNDKYEMYGYENAIKKFAEAVNESPEKIIEHFTLSAQQWLNGSKQQDDMTFIVFKVK
jgi:serine phosphatase RsbU (regulator of sigma subunit)